MKKIAGVICILGIVTLANAANTNDASQQVQQLNDQIHIELEQIQSTNNAQLKALNDQLQLQLKQMSAENSHQMQLLSNRIQDQMQQLQRSLEQQLKQLRIISAPTK